MEPDQILGGLMLVFLVIMMAKFAKEAEKMSRDAQQKTEGKPLEEKVIKFDKPCYQYSKPHKWEYLSIINQFGETVWIHQCKQCGHKPGQMP